MSDSPFFDNLNTMQVESTKRILIGSESNDSVSKIELTQELIQQPWEEGEKRDWKLFLAILYDFNESLIKFFNADGTESRSGFKDLDSSSNEV